MCAHPEGDMDQELWRDIKPPSRILSLQAVVTARAVPASGMMFWICSDLARDFELLLSRPQLG